MDNNTLRRFIAARDMAFASEARVRAILNEISLNEPNGFIAIVESLFPAQPPVDASEKTTRRYKQAHVAGMVEIGSGWDARRMSFSDFATVYRLELADKHVEAMKHVRSCTGLPLKEAKDYCDLVRDELRAELGAMV